MPGSAYLPNSHSPLRCRHSFRDAGGFAPHFTLTRKILGPLTEEIAYLLTSRKVYIRTKNRWTFISQRSGNELS